MLAILAITSFILVFAFMFRSSRRSGRESGEQGNAVSSTFSVFNAYETAMEGKTSLGGSGNGNEEQRRPDLPMHLTDLTKKENEASGNTPPPVPEKAPRVPLSPPVASSSTLNTAPENEIDLLSEEIETDEWNPLGTSAEGVSDILAAAERESSGQGPTEPRMNSEGPVVEHILPNSEMAPTAGGPVFVRGTSGESLPVELAAGLDGAPQQQQKGMVFVRGRGEESEAMPVRQAQPLNRLSSPLFSLAEGRFPISEFNLRLKLADANAGSRAASVSRILYSIDSSPWKPYEGAEILVPPGATISAYCESTDRDWSDSEKVSREYLVDGQEFEPPRIGASSSRFDKLVNRRVLISIINPNEYSNSRVEYRVDGSLWRPYSGPFRLEAEKYSNTGVKVEARVLGALGAPRQGESEAVVLEIGALEGSALMADAEESFSIDPGALDLGAPALAHGYTARYADGKKTGDEVVLPNVAPASIPDLRQPPEVLKAAEVGMDDWAAAANVFDLFESTTRPPGDLHESLTGSSEAR